jgi:hypothetical protein
LLIVGRSSLGILRALAGSQRSNETLVVGTVEEDEPCRAATPRRVTVWDNGAMPRRLLLLLVVTSALAAGCTLGAPGDEAPVEVTTPGPVAWRRTVATTEILGVGTSPDQAELDVLAAALGEIPQAVWDKAALGTIYRIPNDAAMEEGTAAFAVGPDVYLTDATFARPGGSMTLEAAVVHEMAHTAQFAALGDDDIAAAGGDATVLIRNSALVRQFAAAAGWVEGDDGWRLPDPSGTAGSGTIAPEEDMAEAVAAVALGQAEDFSAARIEWVEEWLGVDAATLARGRPYLPAGATLRPADEPLFDAVAIPTEPGDHVEPAYYALADTRPLADNAAEVAAALAGRGLEGTLGAGGEPVHYTGAYDTGTGRRYWVELWDLRAEPAGHLLLTYVALW